MLNEMDIQQLENVLQRCASYEECEGCPYEWMEDHGIPCYREMAKYSLTYINMLKNKISQYAKKVDGV